MQPGNLQNPARERPKSSPGASKIQPGSLQNAAPEPFVCRWFAVEAVALLHCGAVLPGSAGRPASAVRPASAHPHCEHPSALLAPSALRAPAAFFDQKTECQGIDHKISPRRGVFYPKMVQKKPQTLLPRPPAPEIVQRLRQAGGTASAAQQRLRQALRSSLFCGRQMASPRRTPIPGAIARRRRRGGAAAGRCVAAPRPACSATGRQRCLALC